MIEALYKLFAEEKGLIALLGVVVGALLSEYLRRRARREEYSRVLFDKRFASYEVLWKKINLLHDHAAKLMNDSRELKERLAEWDQAKSEIIDFVIDNMLYFSREIVVHLTSTFAAVDEILKAADSTKLNLVGQQYFKNLFQLRNMIRSESGADAARSVLRKIFRVRYRSEYLDVFRKQKMTGFAGF